MGKIKKRMPAFGMAAVLSVLLIWQAAGEAVFAKPSGLENTVQEKEWNSYKVLDGNEELSGYEGLSGDEIAGQMAYGWLDVDIEPPASISEYLDAVPQEESTFSARAEQTKYDPRNEAGFPKVRNQGSLGSCWAHSAMAMTEMDLWKNESGNITSELNDMSEFQTVYFMNHDWKDPLDLCSGDNFRGIAGGSTTKLPDTWYTGGGNTAFTKFMLMDWVGSVSETEHTDTAYSILQEKQKDAFLSDDYAIKKDIAHIQDVYVINTKDQDVIKQMVAEHGAVGISYYHSGQTTGTDGTSSSTYYNAGTHAYYSTITGMTNHAVVIVGWDDDFSVESFNTKPEAKGAWLVKNSWGSSWGDGGYFWLSYKEKSLDATAYAFRAAARGSADYYDHNYQYDGGISTLFGRYDKRPEVQEANIFTAQNDEILKAAAIYTYENHDYTIDVYKDLTDKSNPLSGTLVQSVSGTQFYQGYHTVELPSDIKLNRNETFSIVVTLKNRTQGEDAKFALDSRYLPAGGWIYSQVEAKPGESFVRPVTGDQNRKWDDLALESSPANLRIKAYTVDADTERTGLYLDQQYTKPASASDVCIYAGGDKNNKNYTLYTDIAASFLYSIDSKGRTKKSAGKVVAGITSSREKPVLNKGKIVDKEAAQTASASIKSGRITVTAKKIPEKVYLWVIDTGDAGLSACCPVTVKAAPSVTEFYAIPDTDEAFQYGTTKSFKSTNINAGEFVRIYLYPAYKKGREKVKAPDAAYTAEADAKSAGYFAVSQINPLCYEIRATGLKDGKITKGRITFKCAQNGKKTVLGVSAVNQARSISIENPVNLSKDGPLSISITASAIGSQGTFEVMPSLGSSEYAATDKLKIYAMGSENGYDGTKLAQGKIKVAQRASSEQKKIRLKLEKDKKTITVKAAKKISTGTKTYFLLVYNTQSDTKGKGYEVLTVTAV